VGGNCAGGAGAGSPRKEEQCERSELLFSSSEANLEAGGVHGEPGEYEPEKGFALQSDLGGSSVSDDFDVIRSGGGGKLSSAAFGYPPVLRGTRELFGPERTSSITITPVLVQRFRGTPDIVRKRYRRRGLPKFYDCCIANLTVGTFGARCVDSVQTMLSRRLLLSHRKKFVRLEPASGWFCYCIDPLRRKSSHGVQAANGDDVAPRFLNSSAIS